MNPFGKNRTYVEAARRVITLPELKFHCTPYSERLLHKLVLELIVESSVTVRIWFCEITFHWKVSFVCSTSDTHTRRFIILPQSCLQVGVN